MSVAILHCGARRVLKPTARRAVVQTLLGDRLGKSGAAAGATPPKFDTVQMPDEAEARCRPRP